jgi:hypothetical protein
VSLREISDENGNLWQVFDVHPANEARALNEKYVGGWLCFLSDKGRRRVAPIPDGWEDMSDGALRRLLSVAPPTGESPRPAQ